VCQPPFCGDGIVTANAGETWTATGPQTLRDVTGPSGVTLDSDARCLRSLALDGDDVLAADACQGFVVRLSRP